MTKFSGDQVFSQIIKSSLRVNHAGEFGAKRIYEGQEYIFRMKQDSKNTQLIQEMKEHEKEHLEYFENKIRSQRIRPTIMTPIWSIGGFLLGAGSAILGPKVAMACTVAVEEVIQEHYQTQLDQLENEFNKDVSDSSKNEQIFYYELYEKIQKFRDDEIHHKEIGIENHAEDMFGYNHFSCAVTAITKIAIEISKRI